ncbi:hypothetical protein BGX27_003156 [Mortierella sp. AM989]|nr:hypothetical protein BGX27_003156 [Mortierella sp. AM989]
MFHTLFNSRNSVPHRAKFAMLFTIIASLTATLTDKGITRYITLEERTRITHSMPFKSWQSVSLGLESTFSGWATSVFHGDSIVDAMKLMINTTRNIPEATQGLKYIAHTSPYQIECGQIDGALNGGFRPFRSNTSGCFVAELLLPLRTKTNGTLVQPSNNRWSLMYPDIKMLNTNGPASLRMLSISDNHVLCNITEMSPLSMHLKAKGGMPNLPVTLTKKCALESGETAVMSLSTMWFSSQTVRTFSNTANTVFKERDELVHSMDVAIRNTTYKSPSTLLIEGRSSGTVMDVILCLVMHKPDSSDYYPSCLYITSSTFTIKRQGVNPLLAKMYENKSLKSESSMNYLMLAEHVLPMVNGASGPATIGLIKDATVNATDLMASMAYSFYANLEERNMYLLFDVLATEKGLKVPNWLIACVVSAMVACCFIWGLTEYLLDERYTGSLYKVLSIKVSTRLDVKAPMLMRCKVDPIEFEGVLVGLGSDMAELTDLSRFNSKETLLT